MKVFVTGGSGFVGKHVVSKLLARGHAVYGLARSDSSAALIKELGAEPIRGNILEKESMRAGMQDSDLVYHIAGWYKLGPYDKTIGERINVEGTRNTLGLAHELEIPKIVYTSTVGVFGDTHSEIVDETYQMPADQPFLSNYDRTKWKAHYEVVRPLVESGAPIITVLPGGIYGPGDTSLIGNFMRLYYKYPIPVFPIRDLALTFAHVDDIAEGHILAAERGLPGEEYILAGPVLYVPELVKLWSRISYKNEPFIYLPSSFVTPMAPLVGYLETVFPGWPDLLSQEAIGILDVTYAATAAKAERQLGWKTRDLEIGMRETFDWLGQTNQPLTLTQTQRKQIGITALGAALGLMLIWLIMRQRDSKRTR